MTYSIVRLGAYEQLKAAASKGGKASTGQMVLCASAAGALGGLAGNPADIILVRCVYICNADAEWSPTLPSQRSNG
jgi:dicarboxylate transporter 10